jgi:L-threonine kinase
VTRQVIGKAPRAQLVIIDPGGKIDTLKFNQQPNLCYLNTLKEKEVRQALELVTRGLEGNDLEMLGRGTTVSALANQHILPKSELPLVLKLAEELKAVGVVIAHSGTVMGLIFAEDIDIAEVPTYIRRKNPHWQVSLARIINGGVDRGE